MEKEDGERQGQDRSGAEYIVSTLQQKGVTTVFGYPGGAIMPLYDALYQSPVEHVLCRHEQGAGMSAIGFARASGKVGVCIATSGPGGDQSGDRSGRSHAGFSTPYCPDRAGVYSCSRYRCFSGGRYAGAESCSDQAQLYGDID